MIIKVDKKHSPDRDKIAPKKLISGSGETSLWNAFSDPSDQFHVGHWMSDPCEINVSYTENELCVIVEGEVELTGADGQTFALNKGEAFVIPAGFHGIWKSITKVVKIYAIFENKDKNENKDKDHD